ncbi:MAG: beta-ketoacyl-[acyl-carrier-protein] synthase family protein [Rhodospirillaceae bacterium]|nr:beta-ketoacyl-[acyl-carrier-protein] synthase family protein [Rhodospirillaceae bacterium]
MTNLYLSAVGLATPLGVGKGEVCENLINGSTAGLRLHDDYIKGSEVLLGEVTQPLPEMPAHLSTFDSRNCRMLILALQEIAAEVEATVQRFGRDRIAIVLGTSTSGLDEGEAAFSQRVKTGAWPDTFSYAQQETGSPAEFLAQYLGLDGVAYTIATACSSSGKAMAAGRRLIETGVCDAAIVGGCDTLCHLTVYGFNALEAVSKGRCNPSSVHRDGITIGEGAALFILTPDAGDIRFMGAGETSDAYHISAPHPQGDGARAAMEAALADAGLKSDQIAYLNLHGTATEHNDRAESHAVHAVFGPDLPCSSTKPMTGHMLGAAAGGEAAFLWLTLHPAYGNGRLPPHIWDGAVDPELAPLNLVPMGASTPLEKGSAMLSNSFAFSGSNIALILGRA